MAAAVALFLLIQLTRSKIGEAGRIGTPEVLGLCEQRGLSDGSHVDLNRGASIAVQFTPAKRHVRLERGEAFFAVASDSVRPFVVEAGGVEIRAIGTSFSVTHGRSAVAVLVTEGEIKVTAPAQMELENAPTVKAGQRAVVSLGPTAPAPTIATITARQIEEHLAWKPRLLEFDDATLVEIIEELNRRNPVELTIVGPELKARRLSATIRSDNVEGFLTLLQSDFGIRVERTSAGGITLRHDSGEQARVDGFGTK